MSGGDPFFDLSAPGPLAVFGFGLRSEPIFYRGKHAADGRPGFSSFLQTSQSLSQSHIQTT